MLTIKPTGPSDAPVETPPQEAATAETPVQAEKPQKPIPLMWIPATLGLGLLLATVYLGGRILAAKSHAAAAVQSASIAKPVAPAPVLAQRQATAESPKPAAEVKPAPQAQTVVQPVAQAKPAVPANQAAEAKPVSLTKPAAQAPIDGIPVAEIDGDIALINPQAGQRYIQIGALGPKATRTYLGELRRQSLDPHVAPGPSPDLLRILVGPFEDKDLLLAVQARLDAAGIQNFIRRY